MSYTTQDAQHDAEALFGPCCPQHGNVPCDCCVECGEPDGQHEEWCCLAEPDDDVCCCCGDTTDCQMIDSTGYCHDCLCGEVE